MDLRGTPRLIAVGFMIGVAFVLPGVSGAVIAVVFGIFERMLFVLSDLRRNLRSEMHFVACLAAGLVMGMLSFSFLYGMIPEEYGAVVLLGFLGLIIGQVPEVCRLAAKGGEPVRAGYVLCAAAGVAVMVPMAFMGHGDPVSASDHSPGTVLLTLSVGLLMGATALIPGLNGPTFLTALGLYGLFMGVLGGPDLLLLVPLAAGGVLGGICVSKVLVRILRAAYHPFYYVILGLTVGSVLLTFLEVDPGVDPVYGALALLAGLAVSLSFTRSGRDLPDGSA